MTNGISIHTSVTRHFAEFLTDILLPVNLRAFGRFGIIGNVFYKHARLVFNLNQLRQGIVRFPINLSKRKAGNPCVDVGRLLPKE